MELSGNITLLKVKNGQDGASGAVPSIGENGNWFINGVDTNISAKGESIYVAKIFYSLTDFNGNPIQSEYDEVISIRNGGKIKLECFLYYGSDVLENNIKYRWFKNGVEVEGISGNVYEIPIEDTFTNLIIDCYCYSNSEESTPLAEDTISFSEIVDVEIYSLELGGTPRRFLEYKEGKERYTISPSGLPIYIYKNKGFEKTAITGGTVYIKANDDSEFISAEYFNGYYNFELAEWYDEYKINKDEKEIVPVIFRVYLNKADETPIGQFYFDDAFESEYMQVQLNNYKWQALIDNNSMVFDTTGLTLNNGAFKINYVDNESGRSETLFEYDTSSESLFIKTLNANIGGWIIDDKGLRDNDSEVWLSPQGREATLSSGQKFNNIVFKAGDTFFVDKDGILHAEDVDLSGEVKATSGTIGKDYPFNIVDKGLDCKVTTISNSPIFYENFQHYEEVNGPGSYPLGAAVFAAQKVLDSIILPIANAPLLELEHKLFWNKDNDVTLLYKSQYTAAGTVLINNEYSIGISPQGIMFSPFDTSDVGNLLQGRTILRWEQLKDDEGNDIADYNVILRDRIKIEKNGIFPLIGKDLMQNDIDSECCLGSEKYPFTKGYITDINASNISATNSIETQSLTVNKTLDIKSALTVGNDTNSLTTLEKGEITTSILNTKRIRIEDTGDVEENKIYIGINDTGNNSDPKGGLSLFLKKPTNLNDIKSGLKYKFEGEGISTEVTPIEISFAGSITVNANTVNAKAFNNISDKREKENIQNLSEAIQFDNLFNSLRPVTFNYINQEGRHYGLIAQEVLQSLKECGLEENSSLVSLNRDENRYYINYIEIIPMLIHEVQKLKGQIADLMSS